MPSSGGFLHNDNINNTLNAEKSDHNLSFYAMDMPKLMTHIMLTTLSNSYLQIIFRWAIPIITLSNSYLLGDITYILHCF